MRRAARGARPAPRRLRCAAARAVLASGGLALACACGPQLAFGESGGVARAVTPPIDGNVSVPTPTPDPNSVGNGNAVITAPTIAELLLNCHSSAGNSLGVGVPCPSGSGQCGGQAPYCTGDYTAFSGVGSPLCTQFCQSATACGDGGARCVPDPNNSLVFVCVPGSCIPTSTSLPTPTPLQNCLPNGGRGNSAGIGKSCTMSTDCNIVAGQNCTSVLQNAPLAFCSRTCQADSDCYSQGSAADAVCILDPVAGTGNKGCVPVACVP